jgi:hypothetical protein
MSNYTIVVIIDSLRDLAYTVVYVAAAVVVYLALQRPKVKEWLNPAGALARVVVFLALTALVDWPLSLLIGDLFNLLESLVTQEPVIYPIVRCLSGTVVLVAMTIGVVLLARDSGKAGEES